MKHTHVNDITNSPFNEWGFCVLLLLFYITQKCEGIKPYQKTESSEISSLQTHSNMLYYPKPKGKESSMNRKFSNMRIENQVVVVVVVRNADLFVVEGGI